MAEYKLFRQSTGAIEAVKIGWSWPGFFFSVFWAMAKRMWWLGLSVFVAVVALVALLGRAADYMSRLSNQGKLDVPFGLVIAMVVLVQALPFILGFVFGLKGNAWRVRNLIARQFEHVGTVTASGPEEAVRLTPGANASTKDDRTTGQ